MNTADYHLVDEEGRPFFWLADTAWNLWCKGTADQWDEYLSVRKAQGFTVIQFVAGWWRGSTRPIHGRPFDLADGRLVYDEAAWKSLDLLFEKIRAHGLIAAPIMLWTLTEIDPGQVLSEEQCVEVAQKQLDRWNGSDVIWLLGGDGNYTSPEAEARWKRIGRAVFGERTDVLATLHPCGVTWVGDAFAGESWYRIATIQSGHGSAEEHLRFLVDGEYAKAWTRLRMPFLNLEPNYEDARSYHEGKHFTAYHVRRASYWSTLLAPTAGVTYGIGSIWIWATTEGEIAENHDSNWAGKPWDQELYTPGAESVTILKDFFEKLPWTDLRPAPELLANQPGVEDLKAWQAVAATEDRRCIVVYAPTGGPVALTGAPTDGTVHEVDPASGSWKTLDGGAEALSRATPTPDSDRLYVLEATSE